MDDLLLGEHVSFNYSMILENNFKIRKITAANLTPESDLACAHAYKTKWDKCQIQDLSVNAKKI